MGRLESGFLERIELFAHRVVRVAEELERAGKSKRIIDQMLGAGTSVGANVFEADESMSRKDFVKTLAIANKELSETRFWLRLAQRSEWIPADRLGPLLMEAEEIKRIVGTMIAKVKAADRKAAVP